MEVSGICGTDKHTCQGYVGQYGATRTPRCIPSPIIQGPENVDTIAAVGESATCTDFEGVPLEIAGSKRQLRRMLLAQTNRFALTTLSRSRVQGRWACASS
jgi:hypothetical protein